MEACCLSPFVDRSDFKGRAARANALGLIYQGGRGCAFATLLTREIFEVTLRRFAGAADYIAKEPSNNQ